MDINLLVNRLKTGTIDSPPNSAMLKAAEAIQHLAARIEQDQETIMNLQHQVNQLLQENEQLQNSQTTTAPSGEAG